MSEFHVAGVYPVSFMDKPFVVGLAAGEFAVGESVTLRKFDGTTVVGRVESMHIHETESGMRSLVFSDEISRRVRPGDVIQSS